LEEPGGGGFVNRLVTGTTNGRRRGLTDLEVPTNHQFTAMVEIISVRGEGLKKQLLAV